MKRTLSILLLMISTLMFAKTDLTIYTYDSFGWVKDKLIEDFEAKNKCNIKVVKFDNTGKILARLKLEKVNPRADVVIGLTPTLAEKAKSENLLEKYGKITNLEKIKNDDLIFDSEGFVIPYDYGALAIVYNPEKLDNKPASFEDITKMEKKLIISDPRTSTTGQDFLLWTIAVYGDNWKAFWKRLKPAILTVSPGWSEAFAKFEVGEAPMMVSYGTDGAYSYHNYKSTKYKAFIPKEGGYIQEEGAGIAAGSKNKQLAGKFLNFMLSQEFQSEIPLNQWMFPVVEIDMPEAFEYAVTPEKKVVVDAKELNDNLEKWLSQWEEIMQ